MTRELLFAGLSPCGGWNKHQLAKLGILWPPVKGWTSRLMGKEVSDSDYADFLRLSVTTKAERKIIASDQMDFAL